MFRSVVRLLFATLILPVLAACSLEPDTGPIDVVWEEDACKRCSMVLGDSYHAAQIRQHFADGSSKAYLFDDIGCAVVWLEKKSWKDDAKTEIWVNDHSSGAWIDARGAYYVGGQQTPMFYGLGAQQEATPGSVDFAAAKQHIFRVEERMNPHGTH